MEASAQGAGAARQQATQEMPPVAPAPPAAPGDDKDLFAERPELFVGAAFAGGLLLAKLLGRAGR